MENLINIISDSWYIILTILGFSFIIFVHELGHYLMAKRAGVKVDKFYIGFDFGGLKIFSFVKNETEYGIGIFPFGGYVKLHGYEELPGHESEIKDLPKAHFHSKSVGERFGIMVGGVAMNFISAVFLILIMYGIGKEFAGPVIGKTYSVSAIVGGLKEDDKVISIDGKPIKTFLDIRKQVVLGKAGEGMMFKVERDNKVIDLVIVPEMNYEHGVPEIGITPQLGLKIGGIYDGSPANLAGFLPGDTIESVNGKKIAKHYEFDDIVENSPGEELLVGILREKQPLEIKLKPSTRPSYLMNFETGLKNFTPLEISFVIPELPADLAGLKAWDKIVSVNGKNIFRIEDLTALLAETKEEEVSVEIARGNETHQFKLKPEFNKKERKYMLGIHAAQSGDLGPVKDIEVNGPAYAGGIRAKDSIVAIEGETISSLKHLEVITDKNFGKTVTITYNRNEGESIKTLQAQVTLRTPERAGFITRLMRKIQTMSSGNKFIIDSYGLGIEFSNEIKLSQPTENTNASKAGFQKGDVLLGVNFVVPGEEKINTFTSNNLPGGWNSIDMIYGNILSRMSFKKNKMVDIQTNPEKLIVNIKYLRNGKEMETALSPINSISNQKGFSGLVFDEQSVLYRYSSVSEAAHLVYSESIGMLEFTISSFSRLVSGRYNTDALSGPFGIIPLMHKVAKSGIVELLWLVALLSINIGFINFLPFPPLDGGTLFFLMIEKLKGSPVSAKFQIIVANVGVMFLIFLMLFVTMNDISKFV